MNILVKVSGLVFRAFETIAFKPVILGACLLQLLSVSSFFLLLFNSLILLIDVTKYGYVVITFICMYMLSTGTGGEHL